MRKWIAHSKHLVGVAVLLALAVAQFVAFTGLWFMQPCGFKWGG